MTGLIGSYQTLDGSRTDALQMATEPLLGVCAASKLGDARIERCTGKSEQGPGWPIKGSLALGPRGRPALPQPAMDRMTGHRGPGSVPICHSASHAHMRAQ